MKRQLLALLCAAALAGPALTAQAGEPPADQPAAAAQAPKLGSHEAAPTAFDPIAHKRVVEVSEQLRCLVCQNQSIAESNAELAIDLRNQVIAQVKAGKSNKEIIEFMVDRYGDFVLYKPPMNKTTLILWWGPVGLLAVALLFFVVSLKRRKKVVADTTRPLSAEERELAERLLNSDKKE